MATYYVDCTVSGGVGTNTGSGTELSPWTNVASAYAAAAGGDTILIKATKTQPFTVAGNIQDTKGIKFDAWGTGKFYVDASGMTGSYVFRLEHVNSGLKNFDIKSIKASSLFGIRVNANIADGALSDGYVHDSPSSFGIVFDVGITGTVKAYRLHLTRNNINFRINALGVGGRIELYDCRDENAVLYSRADGVNTVVKTYRHLSAGHSSTNFLVINGASVEHIDPIIIGGAKNVAEDIIQNQGAGACLITRGVITYPVLDSGSFTKGFLNSGGGSNAVSAESKGPNGGVSKLFAKARRPAMLCFIRDDVEDYVTGGTYSGELSAWLDILETYGVKGTYPCTTQQGDNPSAITPSQWLEIKSVADRGHEIAGHGRTGGHLRYAGNVGMTMQYTGAATTVRFVISNNRLQTFHNGSGTPTLNIDLLPAGRTLSWLVSQLAANSYTAALVTNGTSTSDTIPARCLSDVDIANAKTASNNLIVDAEKLYQWEVVGAASDILANTGYKMKTHIYSAGSANRTIADKILAGGFLGARLAHAPIANYSDSVSKFLYEDANYHRGEMFGILLETYVNRSSDAALRRSVEAICHWAMWHGVPIALYAHEFAAFSQAHWHIVVSAAKSTGIPIGTYAEVCQFSKSVEQSRLPLAQQQELDDAWQPKLAADSVAIPWYYGAQGGSASGLYLEVAPGVHLPL